MKVVARKSFCYSRTGVDSHRVALGEVTSLIPEALIPGLMAEGLVQRWWPDEERKVEVDVKPQPSHQAVVKPAAKAFSRR